MCLKKSIFFVPFKFCVDPSNPFGTKCPLLLKCGHTACEGCIRNGCRGKDEILCKICATVSEVNKL